MTIFKNELYKIMVCSKCKTETLSGSHIRFIEWQSLLHQNRRKGWLRKKPFHSEETVCANLSDLAKKT